VKPYDMIYLLTAIG